MDVRDSIKNLRFGQQAVLVSVLIQSALPNNKTKPQTFAKIHGKYLAIWKMKQFKLPPAMSSNEFSEIMGLLEVNGLVSVKGGADERARIIGLKCCKEEVEAGVMEKLKEIMTELMPGGVKENN
jgi:hypothetical protein